MVLPVTNTEVHLEQHWDLVIVLYSFILSCVGALSGVSVLTHVRWRDQIIQAPPKGVMRIPQLWCAINLACCAIWCMHFMGMSALSLQPEGGGNIYRMWYRPWVTVASMIVCVVCLWAGIIIASHDCFAGSDRVDVLLKMVLEAEVKKSKKIGRASYSAPGSPSESIKGGNGISIKQIQSRAHQRLVYIQAFLGQLHFLVLGAAVTAAGVVIMHYTGLLACRGDFEIRWNWAWVFVSFAVALVVSIAGFWILFRLLLWRASLRWLRPVCAIVIAVAVCSMHYTSVLAAEYVPSGLPPIDHGHMFQVSARVQIALALLTFGFALYTERSISDELSGFVKDVNLSTLGLMAGKQNQKIIPNNETPRKSGSRASVLIHSQLGSPSKETSASSSKVIHVRAGKMSQSLPRSASGNYAQLNKILPVDDSHQSIGNSKGPDSGDEKLDRAVTSLPPIKNAAMSGGLAAGRLDRILTEDPSSIYDINAGDDL